MAMESTSNKVGYVVMENTGDGKARKISAPFLCESAAIEYAELARKNGKDVFIVGPGRSEK